MRPIATLGSGTMSRHGVADRAFRFDWLLFLSTVAVVVIGILMVRSTELGRGDGYFIRQLTAAGIGLIGMLIAAVLPYQVFRTYVRPLYVVMIGLLIAVLLLGVNLRGTRGWFHLGPVYLQASEVAKLTFVLSLAGYLDRRIQWYSPRALVVPFTLALVPIGMILIQPDLSSSLVFFPATLAMFYVAGARTLHLLAICLVAAMAAGIPLASTYFGLIEGRLAGRPVMSFLADAFDGGWSSVYLFAGVCAAITSSWWFLRKLRIYIPSVYLWVTLFLLGLGTLGAVAADHALKEYQRKRLVAFIDPNLDPLGGGYNVRQSQIAIGSGRVLGKGYGSGTQSQLGFLPSRHTDFIFSVIGEELGFLRSFAVLSLYFMVVWRGFEVSIEARDRFGSLVAVGFSTMFAFYFVLNLGMTMGLAPVAGVPLPLVSYGGSSVLSSMIAVGILLSIHWRRYFL